MIGVCNNLLVDALKSGKIVDTITIYGLLVSYDKWYAIPLKYMINFTENTYKMEVDNRDF